MKNKSLLILLAFCLTCVVGFWWQLSHKHYIVGDYSDRCFSDPSRSLSLLYLLSYFLAAIFLVVWLFYIVVALRNQKKLSAQERVKKTMLYFSCALFFFCLPNVLPYIIPYKVVLHYKEFETVCEPGGG